MLNTCKIIQKEYLYFLAVKKSIHRVIVLFTQIFFKSKTTSVNHKVYMQKSEVRLMSSGAGQMFSLSYIKIHWRLKCSFSIRIYKLDCVYRTKPD